MAHENKLRFALALGAMLIPSGCAGPSGPVYGTWRGRQPSGDGVYSSFVDLVLFGSPGTTQGQYDFRATIANPGMLNSGNRNLEWGDRWTLVPGGAPGAPPVVHLSDLPGGQISDYALMSNGTLVPTTRGKLPDTSPESLRYGLAPVPRDSRGFGRL